MLFCFRFRLLFLILSLTLRDLRLTGAAYAIDIHREPVFSESSEMQIIHSNSQIGRLHFSHLATYRTDLMTVTTVVVAGLILRGPLETMPDHES